MIRQPKRGTRNVNEKFYEFEKRQIELLNEVFEDVELTREEERTGFCCTGRRAVYPRRAHGTLQPKDESIIVGYYTFTKCSF